MLPPGVNQSDFAEALRQFEAVVGKGNVYSSDEDVALYRDPYSPIKNTPGEITASAAVAPKTTEEVQAVVRIAGQYKVPLYPISTGKNLGFGGPAPIQSGSVVLDLKRMNRIIEVSETNAYAVVEPGVSYFDLYRYIQDKGLKLVMSVPDPGWGSVMGNPLDHGFGRLAWPYRDHWDCHCGMEVVLPTGDIIRTGMGGISGAEKSSVGYQVKYGAGPMVDGLFLQSTLGVVTKMGVWLMPQPEAYLRTYVQAFRYNDIYKFCEAYNYLMNTMSIPGGGLSLNPVVHDMMDKHPGMTPPKDPEIIAIMANPAGPDPAALEAYARKTNKGIWGLRLDFQGNKKLIRAQWDYVKEKFSSMIPDVDFGEIAEFDLPPKKEQYGEIELGRFGIPSLSEFFLGTRAMMPNPTYGHLWATFAIPFNGDEVLRAQAVMRQASKDLDFHFNPIQIPYTEWWHSVARLVVSFEVSDNPVDNARRIEAAKKLYKIMADNGWGDIRTHPVLQEALVDTYTFGNHSLRRFHETLKDAIDPEGIMANGKYGVWPKRFRGVRA
jgi:(+)-pinoresinol hydroxylase